MPEPSDRSIQEGDQQTSGGEAPHESLRGIASLERLRDRVEVAAHELGRLRAENQALAERIRELETRPSVDPNETFVTLDRDPELLKRKISGFIEALDHYLERERKHL